ncbi:MAG: hypothetical protein JXA89_27250 [Anaerolineae bacterium]|nr:hypothetical protein [Anaerolineae bacterium]
MGISSGKIITTLRERRQIEWDIVNLVKTGSSGETKNRAQRIAKSGDQVIPVILNNLSHANPQMLNMLGIISSFYPDRDEIVANLYEAAADVDTPDRNRIAAMLILERFLGVEPDPYVVGTLSDPQTMITESIEEMIQEAANEPMMLLEYTQGLAKQPKEVLGDVIETLLQIGQERAVPILCLLAQENDDELANAALNALGRLAHPYAVQGLRACLPMLPPSRRLLGERSLRKLQFKGVTTASHPPQDERWRALISSPDSEGHVAIWFMLDTGASHSLFLILHLDQDRGISDAYGDYHSSEQLLPPRQPKGYIHTVSWKNDSTMCMLEADLAFGRHLAKRAQETTFGLNLPLPSTYRLIGQLIWQYGETIGEAIKPRPLRPSEAQALLPETANLLIHPAFGNWFAYGELTVQRALAIIRWAPLTVEHELGMWAGKLAKAYFDQEKIRQLKASLEIMAEWLQNANQAYLAQVTLAAAETVMTLDPAEHPLTLGMAERGLRFVIQQFQRQVALGLE